MLKKAIVNFIVVLILLISLCCGSVYALQKIKIDKILSVGINKQNNQNEFISIEDIKTDDYGNLYVLDSKRQLVLKYDASCNFVKTIGKPSLNITNKEEIKNKLASIKAGQIKVNKEYLYNPLKLFLKNDKLYILDLDKVSVYSINGEFIKNVKLIGLFPRDIHINNNNEIVVAQVLEYSNNIFHVYDENGNLIRSFGDYFEIPNKYKLLGQNTTISNKQRGFPISIKYFSETEKLYLMNPFEYEIRVINEDGIVNNIKNEKNVRYYPPQGISQPLEGQREAWAIAYMAAPKILMMNGRILVFTPKIINKVNIGCWVEIYNNERREAVSAVDLKSYPACIFGRSINSNEGELYCIEIDNGSYFVGKYLIKML